MVCLALPNFGPAEAVDEALSILFECVGQFLNDPDTASTSTPSSPPVVLEILVVEEAAGRYAEKLRALAAVIPTLNTAQRRFRLHLGRLTALKETDGAVYAQAIAVPCDRRLLPSDHPVAATVFQKAGAALANTAKLLFHRAEPGKVYTIKLTPSSPLRAQQGVEFVLLAMPPCQALAMSLPEGWQEALRGTYNELLKAFVEQAAPKVALRTKKQCVVDKKKAISAVVPPPPVEQEKNQGPPSPIPVYRHPGLPPQSTSWHGGLQQYLQHAAALKTFIFLETPQWMVIYDGYPKAKVHLLLLPKPSFLAVSGVTELRREEHLERLARFHVAARHIATKLQQDIPSLRLRLGYHSVPSMQPLHLHIISQDFNSPALKTKKHWNSFTTPFFLNAADVEAALREQGRVLVDRVNAEALLKHALRCHGCGAGQKNMPALKQHLTYCRQVAELETART